MCGPDREVGGQQRTQAASDDDEGIMNHDLWKCMELTNLIWCYSMRQGDIPQLQQTKPPVQRNFINFISIQTEHKYLNLHVSPWEFFLWYGTHFEHHKQNQHIGKQFYNIVANCQFCSFLSCLINSSGHLFPQSRINSRGRGRATTELASSSKRLEIQGDAEDNSTNFWLAHMQSSQL